MINKRLLLDGAIWRRGGLWTIRVCRAFVGGPGFSADKDFYKILGLSKTADKKEIKAAYASLVKKNHPDVNKGAGSDALIKDINLAYSVLSNDEKRKEYDEYNERRNKVRDFQGGNQGGQSSTTYGPVEGFLL